jgi:hypothetical protein
VPERPDHPDLALDALMAFDNEPLVGTPELAAVERLLGTSDGTRELLDLDLGPPRLRAAWLALRERARPVYAAVVVGEATLKTRRLDGVRLGFNVVADSPWPSLWPPRRRRAR